MTIHSVMVQISPPKGDDTGQVTEGFYTVEDGYLQMVYRDGRKLENPLYRVKLHDGANVQAIAANLTRSIRKDMLGEKVEGFTRNLSYPKAFYA
jgi:hypothetical protein